MNLDFNKSDNYFDTWNQIPENNVNVKHIHVKKNSPGISVDFPEELNPEIINALGSMGINSLYRHQLDSFTLIQCGENVLLNTGTASGKTLAFFLPILQSYLQTKSSHNALFLFPTKALAYDQIQQYLQIIEKLNGSNTSLKYQVPCFVYDGDTPQSKRAAIRKTADFILTNPDMLHLGILPYHTRWMRFLSNLRYVVIDEIHSYKGVFGSHVANVIRRLNRVASFYGQKLQFISTSATIGNPIEFVEKLIEDDVVLIDQNSAPGGKKSIVFYNPPIENVKLGLRKSAFSETIRISHDYAKNNFQTLVFQISRRSVEMSLKVFQDIYGKNSNFIQAYRSGYLANERRDLEMKLRNREIRLLFSTNALELGMDIGGIQNVILCGYPGSITSTLQQIGRAGRKMDDSFAFFVANSSPIDQFLVNHPEYILLRNPESALIDPNNSLILLNHLRCAASEIGFEKGDHFGTLTWLEIEPFLDLLVQSGELKLIDNKYYWISSQTPAMATSLRNMSGETIKLMDFQMNKVIGQVDYSSSLWMVHAGAVYMHQGMEYLVKNLSLEENTAHLEKKSLPYYTQAKRDTKITISETLSSKQVMKIHACFGNIEVVNKIIAFDEILWQNNQKIATKPLDLPEIRLSTQGIWFVLEDEIVQNLRNNKLWLNDPNNYGQNWENIKRKVRMRDQFTCQVCGKTEQSQSFHVHHIKPFRFFNSSYEANQMNNLTTLCPACHKRVEVNVRIRSGLAGLSYLTRNMAPLFLMCDSNDIDVFSEPVSNLFSNKPLFMLYENIPYGIGLSHHMYKILEGFLSDLLQHVRECPCQNGCPSCVGPEIESGYGGKAETIAILEEILT